MVVQQQQRLRQQHQLVGHRRRADEEEHHNEEQQEQEPALLPPPPLPAAAAAVRQQEDPRREGGGPSLFVGGGPQSMVPGRGYHDHDPQKQQQKAKESYYSKRRHHGAAGQQDDDAECILKTALAFVVLRRRVKEYRRPHEQEHLERKTITTTSTSTSAAPEEKEEKQQEEQQQARSSNSTSTGNGILLSPRTTTTTGRTIKRGQQQQSGTNSIRQVYRMALSTAWPLYHSHVIVVQPSSTNSSTADLVDLHPPHAANGSIVTTTRLMTPRNHDCTTTTTTTTSCSTNATTTGILPSFPIYDFHTASLTVAQMKDKLSASQRTNSKKSSIIILSNADDTAAHTTKKDHRPANRSSSMSRRLHTYAVLDGIVSHLATSMVGQIMSSSSCSSSSCGGCGGGCGGGCSCGSTFGLFYHDILHPFLKEVNQWCNASYSTSSISLPFVDTTTTTTTTRNRNHHQQRALQNVLSMCTVLHRLVMQKGRNHPLLVDDLIRGLCRVIQCLYLGEGWCDGCRCCDCCCLEEERKKKVEMQSETEWEGRKDVGCIGDYGGGGGGGGRVKSYDSSAGRTNSGGHKMADIVAVNMLVLLEEMISFKISLAKDEDEIGKRNGTGMGMVREKTVIMARNTKVSQMAEQILRDLNSVLGGGVGEKNGDALDGGLFLPVSVQEMAGFYLRRKRIQQRDQERRSTTIMTSRALLSRGEQVDKDDIISKVEDENNDDVLLRLSSGAKLMMRMYLFDLMHKLSSYHLDS